jgi:hypothetical protein
MKLSDFMIMQKGYFDKRKRDELNFARVGFIIDGFASGLAGQKINVKKWFNDWFGEKEPVVDKAEKKNRSEELMKRVRLTNKILAEKETYAKRVKNSN